MRRTRTWSSLLLIAGLIVFGGIGCSEDDADESTATPTASQATTDASGTAMLDLAGNNVSATVQDTAGQPMEGVDVGGYQGHNNAVVYATASNYYPAMEVLGVSGSSSASDPVGPATPVRGDARGIAADYDVELNMMPVRGYFTGNIEGAASLANLLDDGGFVTEQDTGTVIEMYNSIINGIFNFGNFYVLLHGNAAEASGEGTFAFGVSSFGLVGDAFGELFFGRTSLYEEDVVTYTRIGIEMEVEHGGETITETTWLPVVVVDELIDSSAQFEYKFVLEWEEHPDDLDLHLYTPEIEGSTHHIYYGNQGNVSEAPYAWLDVDDVTSYGPEAMTIEQLFAGTYTAAIYEFGGEGTISTSGATVKVFRERNLIHTLAVPTDVQDGDHWWWVIGEVDGASGEFTVIDEVQEMSPEGQRSDEMPAKRGGNTQSSDR